MEETETVLTLADFGALLRERRIHKGLTEENVAAELKITSRLVKAIEEGDMESMPHMPGDLSGRMRNFLPSTIALPTLRAHCSKIRKKSCANRKSVLSPLRHVARKVMCLGLPSFCARCFLREGHGIFGIVSPDFPAIR